MRIFEPFGRDDPDGVCKKSTYALVKYAAQHGKRLLRHFNVNTALAHYIKNVHEVTAKGMEQVEQLFSEVAGQAVP